MLIIFCKKLCGSSIDKSFIKLETTSSSYSKINITLEKSATPLTSLKICINSCPSSRSISSMTTII